MIIFTRRRIAFAALALVLLGVTVSATTCVGPPSYYSAKYGDAGPAHPTARPVAPIPEKQVEPHTCGLHSLNSVYRAYGLDPETLRLRFRLGVDKPAINLIPSSRGTIHPDMLRVLEQDGFDAEVVRSGKDSAASLLTAHLDQGHLAVVLIEAGDLHWVVLSAGRGDNVLICDSLREEPYEEPLESYLKDRVHSVLLVQPRRI